MNNNGEKIVNFYKWCKLCKHIDLYESDKDWDKYCEECLSNPVNQNSERPVMWEEKE